MCGYFCKFTDFVLADKKLSDYTNLFSPHDFKKNDDIILTQFKKLMEVILLNAIPLKQLTKEIYLNKQNL